jgi:hypothetical protein
VSTAATSAWFDGDKFHPALPGNYKVRNRVRLNHRNPNALIGAKRFWDGQRWLCWEGGLQSVFGDHSSHQWCGLASDPAEAAPC